MTQDKLEELKQQAIDYMSVLSGNSYAVRGGILVKREFNKEKIEKVLIGAIAPLVDRILELESYLEDEDTSRHF